MKSIAKSTNSEIRTIHAGHLYINATHWLRHCPLCVALMAKADAIAKETTNET